MFSKSLEIQPILETSRTDLICSLTAQDLGITFLPDYATEGGIRSGSLTYLDVKGFEIDVRKQLLYHRDKWVSPQMECVLRYCQDKAFT